jgi:hypothetical protein
VTSTAAPRQPIPLSMTERQGLTARRVLLDGLTRDADIFQLVSELAPLHPRDNICPGEVFRRIATDALD